jgi:hypothetical protein
VTHVIAESQLLHDWLGADLDKVIVVRPDRYVAGTFQDSNETAFAAKYAATLGLDTRNRANARTEADRIPAAPTAQV